MKKNFFANSMHLFFDITGYFLNIKTNLKHKTFKLISKYFQQCCFRNKQDQHSIDFLFKKKLKYQFNDKKEVLKVVFLIAFI